MLDGRDFEDVPVQEILDAAQVSASSLYGRFRDKEVLLRALHQRHFERVRAIAEQTVESGVWDELPLREIGERLIRILIGYRRQYEPRVRSLRLAERRYPDLEQRRLAVDSWMLDVGGNYFERRMADSGRQFDRRGFALACYLLACSIDATASSPGALSATSLEDEEWMVESLTRMMTDFLDFGDA